jgi:hypothetical protein
MALEVVYRVGASNVIHNGSIEVIRGDESFGFPITALHPLGSGAVRASQIKGRTGVQVGSRQDLDEETLSRLGPTHVESWSGNTGDGQSVTVRIYETSAGG